MLSDLVEVQQRLFQLLGEGGDAAEGGTFQLLALEERLGVLDEADVVAGDGLAEVLGGAQLAEGDAELRLLVGASLGACIEFFWDRTYVVGIVEGVEEILVERVHI